MKKRFYVFFGVLMVIFSCTHQARKTEKKIPSTNLIIDVNKDSDSRVQGDTVLIFTELGDTLKYSKAHFNSIVHKHKEFFEEYPDHPDLCYFKIEDKGTFASEAGQDNYYMLYAYFLKQKNGVKENAPQRQKLIALYTTINELFEQFEYDSPYFLHQSIRILGYAEYAVSLLPKSQNDFSKTYTITKQKDLYIKSLRQLIEDESEINNHITAKEKLALNKKVDLLNQLITDYFYLRRSQEFQYSYYK